MLPVWLLFFSKKIFAVGTFGDSSIIDNKQYMSVCSLVFRYLATLKYLAWTAWGITPHVKGSFQRISLKPETVFFFLTAKQMIVLFREGGESPKVKLFAAG